MSSMDTGQLIYLAMLLGAVLFWFVTANRGSRGTVAQHALMWVLIFFGVVAVYGLWADIRHTIVPRQSVFAEAGRIEVPRSADGHYYLTLDVNGVPTRFVVDTGATSIVLLEEDARAAGFDPSDLIYASTAMTANGPVRTARVVLDEIGVGAVTDRRVGAYVNEGAMPESLLGMSYLQRFDRLEISGGTLILER
ncbi:TIGR02281 family clan AA aspartic protease [Primorskyibacter aestuariivivens]|uniref:retropepsin-like aspartic protease family protein n=1 Tax=Primorskyibacter aestuariivivens TaxID=1888912 RepID=UPI0023006920|nr:TIGR02281 family clan AA aspartic protease [Primorskyibacter aestuariivivens]MDA7430574.1 TIGR02281 family clan AA aspartic protease [Primorskyibacter aestuariivivens]